MSAAAFGTISDQRRLRKDRFADPWDIVEKPEDTPFIGFTKNNAWVAMPERD
jgi:hypothetical protein